METFLLLIPIFQFAACSQDTNSPVLPGASQIPAKAASHISSHNSVAISDYQPYILPYPYYTELSKQSRVSYQQGHSTAASSAESPSSSNLYNIPSIPVQPTSIPPTLKYVNTTMMSSLLAQTNSSSDSSFQHSIPFGHIQLQNPYYQPVFTPNHSGTLPFYHSQNSYTQPISNPIIPQTVVPTITTNHHGSAGASNQVSNTNIPGTPSALKTPRIPEPKKFALLKHLEDAMGVNLVNRIKANDRTKFEEIIYMAHNGLANGMWEYTFMHVLNEWRMFGDLEESSYSLAFYGLLRICEASGFEVNIKFKGGKEYVSLMRSRVNSIFKLIYNNSVELDVSKIYQTLLLLYSSFLQHANAKELDVLKKKCTAEKKIMNTNRQGTSSSVSQIAHNSDSLNTSSQTLTFNNNNLQISSVVQNPIEQEYNSSLPANPTTYGFTCQDPSATTTAPSFNPPPLEQTPTLISGQFKHAGLLREASEMNLEEVLLSSLDMSPLDFMKDIYDFYQTRNGKWNLIFVECLEKWELFEDYNGTPWRLAYFSFLRVLDASGFELENSLTSTIPSNDLKMNQRMKTIIEMIVGKVCIDSSSKLYQTLLVFYGRYKSEASKDELNAILFECKVEKVLKQQSKKRPGSINPKLPAVEGSETSTKDNTNQSSKGPNIAMMITSSQSLVNQIQPEYSTSASFGTYHQYNHSPSHSLPGSQSDLQEPGLGGLHHQLEVRGRPNKKRRVEDNN